MSSKAFAFVVLSFFRRFLYATARFGSDIAARSGGSETYDKGDEYVLKPPKLEAPNPAPNAARPLLAWDLNCFLLIVTVPLQAVVPMVDGKVASRESPNIEQRVK